jgi:uncharacterized protein (DUF1778 family)
MATKNKEITIGFRVKPQERKYLDRKADERGQKLSDYIRNLLLPSGVVIDSDGKIRA